MNPQESIPTEQETLLRQHRQRLAFKWLDDPGYYSRLFGGESLAPEEARILGRYGCWMRALAEGEIAPFTDAQRKFVELSKGNKAGETEFEVAYLKYQRIKSASITVSNEWDYYDTAYNECCSSDESSMIQGKDARGVSFVPSTADELSSIISQYQQLSADLVLEFKDDLDWKVIPARMKVDENLIREFKDKIDWSIISRNQELSEEIIREYKDFVDWAEISRHQKLSGAFVREFENRIVWFLLAENPKISGECYQELKDFFVQNDSLAVSIHEDTISDAFIAVFCKQLSSGVWRHILTHRQIDVSILRACACIFNCREFKVQDCFIEDDGNIYYKANILDEPQLRDPVEDDCLCDGEDDCNCLYEVNIFNKLLMDPADDDYVCNREDNGNCFYEDASSDMWFLVLQTQKLDDAFALEYINQLGPVNLLRLSALGSFQYSPETEAVFLRESVRACDEQEGDEIIPFDPDEEKVLLFRNGICLEDILKLIYKYDAMYWDKLNMVQDLSEDIMKRFPGKVNWGQQTLMGRYFSEDLIKHCSDKIKWSELLRRQSLSEDLIRSCSDKIDWMEASKYQCLSESIIAEFADKVDWSRICQYQTLSENFMRRFQNRLDWGNVSRFQKLSESFLVGFLNKVDWIYICKERSLPSCILRLILSNKASVPYSPNVDNVYNSISPSR